VRRRIIDLVKRGLTLKEACQLVGIGYRTAQKYLSKNPEYLKARMEARLTVRWLSTKLSGTGMGVFFGVLLKKARRQCKSAALQKFCKEGKGAGGGI
jgi:hypothetical protein